jgi:hypothetical protein
MEKTLDRGYLFLNDKKDFLGQENVKDDERPDCPETIKTDENVDKARPHLKKQSLSGHQNGSRRIKYG